MLGLRDGLAVIGRGAASGEQFDDRIHDCHGAALSDWTFAANRLAVSLDQLDRTQLADQKRMRPPRQVSRATAASILKTPCQPSVYDMLETTLPATTPPNK